MKEKVVVLVENKSYTKLKNKVDSALKGGGIISALELVEECGEMVDCIILDGMNSSNSMFSSYCVYASMLSKGYEIGDYVARVSLYDNTVRLEINPINLVLSCKNEEQVLFVIAHEVKHLLFSHLVKYMSLYREDVTALFLNLATDVEVNETIKSEIFSRKEGYISPSCSDSIPKDIFDMKSMANLLGVDLQTLLHECWYVAKKYTTADFLYKKLNKKCKVVLGYSINEILYNCKISDKDFCNELFAVVEHTHYSVFDIKDPIEAERFCKELIKYLKKKEYVSVFNMDDAKQQKSSSLGDSLEVPGLGDDSNPDEISDAIEEIRKAVSAVIENMGGLGSGKGRSPIGDGGRYSVAYKKYRSVVPWQNYLYRKLMFMSNVFISTKRRINRRNPDRLELSGRKKEPLLQIVVAVDESGSISNKEYLYFLLEIKSILKNFNCELHLYEFTAKVENYTYYSNKNIKKFNPEDFGKYRYHGGTTFQNVFDDVSNNRKINKRECMFIMFTDGMGEHEVDFCGVKNRLWVIVGKDSKLSCKDSDKNIFPIVDIKEA